MAPRPVSIVPHTHWDREWYEPFAVFRHRLVVLFDTLLDVLEADPAYTHFLLDGQTQVVDDYLEVRPDAAARIAALAASGRVSVGPWRVLMDEAMVSGETIVRDLQMGLARAAELGGAMEVGYLPDMFCHVAQMPQLLKLAGFTDAVLWRGVPRAIDTTGFWWEAPDGSAVRVEYLFGSYSNASAIPPSGDALVDLARRYDDEVGRGLVGAMLLMHGSDHQVPVPWLPKVVVDANAATTEYEFAIRSLADHVRAQPRDVTLPRWRGELRSGARANVLMGTASNHVDVHQRAAAAERALERVAEPLAALLLPAARYPRPTLRMAWDQLVLNSAHDSSCACSHDDTVAAVNVRYADARHLAEAVVDDVLAAFAATVDAPRGAFVAVNPTARPRAGVVELTRRGRGLFHLVGADGEALPAQLVDERLGDTISTVVQGTKVHWLLTLIRNGVAAGLRTARVDVEEHDNEHHITFHPALDGDAAIDVEPVLERMQAWGATGAVQRVTMSGAPQRTVAVATATIDGFGWATLGLAEGPSRAHGGVAVADDLTLSNGRVDVVVDRDDGTFTMLDVASGVRATGLGRLVEGGDGGDTYNYSPPPGDVVVAAPAAVRIRVSERGPVRGRIDIERDYAWPTHAIGDHLAVTARADERATVTVHTRLELRTGERFVRVRHDFDNPSRDHRVRVHFPLPAAVAGSDAECAFTVVRRGLTAEGGPQERGLPTFVSRRFVDCSDGTVGLAVVHDGLLEYEVVDGDHQELALTLLRSTGWISRASMTYRSEPAGPFVATPGAQLVGPVHADYAVLLHDGDWRAADLHGRADEVLVPFVTARAPGSDTAGRATHGSRGSMLAVDGAEVSAVLRDEEGRLVVRLFATAPETVIARVAVGGAAAPGEVIDLRGRRVARFDGSIELRPHEIVTVRLADDDCDEPA